MLRVPNLSGRKEIGLQKSNSEESRGKQQARGVVDKEVEARVGGQRQCKICFIICLTLPAGMKSRGEKRMTCCGVACSRYR